MLLRGVIRTMKCPKRTPPRKFVNVYFEKLAKLTTEFILESKFECDQTNQLLGTTKDRVDPETGWKWYDTQPAASSSSSGWQPSAWWQLLTDIKVGWAIIF